MKQNISIFPWITLDCAWHSLGEEISATIRWKSRFLQRKEILLRTKISWICFPELEYFSRQNLRRFSPIRMVDVFTWKTKFSFLFFSRLCKLPILLQVMPWEIRVKSTYVHSMFLIYSNQCENRSRRREVSCSYLFTTSSTGFSHPTYCKARSAVATANWRDEEKEFGEFRVRGILLEHALWNSEWVLLEINDQVKNRREAWKKNPNLSRKIHSDLLYNVLPEVHRNYFESKSNTRSDCSGIFHLVTLCRRICAERHVTSEFWFIRINWSANDHA